MKRRSLTMAGGLLATTSALGILGCNDRRHAVKSPLPALPEFDAARLQAKLEELRLAYEARGFNVSETLQPALSADEVTAQCGWFPAPIPKEILALYGWRGGQLETREKKDFPFSFRDCAFVTPADARHEYESMMQTYGANPGGARRAPALAADRGHGRAARHRDVRRHRAGAHPDGLRPQRRDPDERHRHADLLRAGGRPVPSYLGSSFAFIGVVIAATGYAGKGANANLGVGAGRHHRLRRAVHADRRLVMATGTAGSSA
jgi:hypothetical protein